MTVTAVVRGSGSIGQRHARVLRSLGADTYLWPVRPRPVSGPDPATGATLLDDASGPAAVARADLVVVATDTSRHVADTVAALDLGGARVLLEKPVAPSLSAAEPLATHPRRGDVWVAAPLRAHAAFQHLVALLPSIGRPVSAHVWCQSWLPDWRPDRDYRDSYSARAEEGGVLRDLVHELDYVSVLLGDPALVGARLDHHGPLEIDAEQSATLLWSTPLASAVTVRLDYVTRPSTRGIVVRGPGGSLEWTVASATVRHTDPSGRVAETTFAQDLDRDTVMATQAGAALALHPSATPGTRLAAGAPATLAEGLSTLALCDAARAASARASATKPDVPDASDASAPRDSPDSPDSPEESR